MPSRLIIAFTLSLVLHGSLLVADAIRPSSQPRTPALLATLRLPPEPEPASPPEPPPLPDTLLKNTIEEERSRQEEPAAAPPREERKQQAPRKKSLSEREIRAVRKKLSEYVFYPEQARKMGIEGTVVLFVELADDGRIQDVRVVSSSGFPILDNAAIKGFYAVGRLPGKSDTWSYAFHLE